MRVEVLVGMIASGKSTYARKRADAGALVVSHDDLSEMLHARYRYEPELRECYRRMEEDLVVRAMQAGRDVIIDRTHLTKESRARWVDYVHPFWNGSRIDIIAVRFPIEAPEVHASRRVSADSRGRSYEEWLRVATHHAEQAQKEPLGDGEGFDEIVDAPPVDLPILEYPNG